MKKIAVLLAMIAVMLLCGQAVAEKGLLGIFSGPFTAASAGLGAAVLAALLVSLIARPKEK